MAGERVAACLAQLSQDVADLCLTSTCTVLDAPPDPLVFYREFVAASRPVVIRGCLEGWPARSKWTGEYLAATLGDAPLSVEVTPSGLGDAVVDGVFVMPDTQQMTMGGFLDAQARTDCVAYVSQQNSNLTGELGPLAGDVRELGFARTAFGGAAPDAVNFWLGPDAAVTSLHKDHYENMYCVLQGEKVFTLLPPTDAPWLYERPYRVGHYRQAQGGGGGDGTGGRRGGGFEVVMHEEAPRPWIPVDPDSPDLARYPDFRHASPLTVRVQAGEVLFLPSLWFHKVQQRGATSPLRGLTLAVNFWYDMRFGMAYCYFSLLRGLSAPTSAAQEEQEEDEEDEEEGREAAG